MNSSDDDKQRTERHNKRMQRHKKVVDAKMAKATQEQGIILILTGNGKGKSSSAFGMLARSLGHGHKCAVVQFIKGQQDCGENLFFNQHDRVDFLLMKTGFTWETQNFEADKEAAITIWQQAKEFLKTTDYDLVIFDEITYMFKYKYLDEAEFIETLVQRPSSQSVIITGRGASKNLIEVADTVTECQLTKHAFNEGIKARKGIEF
ncbi:MAG: cob(I)yrinic acid a,c-diamide adenosyltransferase [Pseudomonadota bacterium]